jgi:hypothetical protein
VARTNKKTTKIRLVEIDDWCAVYVDGKSVYQGHDCDVGRFLSVLEDAGVKLNADIQTGYAEQDEDEAHETGGLPDNIADLKSPGFA